MIKRSKKSLAQRIALVRRGRGCLKRVRGEKPLSEWWEQHKAKERELEEKRLRGFSWSATEGFKYPQ